MEYLTGLTLFHWSAFHFQVYGLLVVQISFVRQYVCRKCIFCVGSVTLNVGVAVASLNCQ